jgi:hypothetical protein
MLALRHATKPIKWAGLGDHIKQAILPEEQLNTMIPMVVALDLSRHLIVLMRILIARERGAPNATSGWVRLTCFFQ